MRTLIDQLFVGRVRLMLPEGEATGIFKAPVAGRLHLSRTGLAGDEQADRVHHGGPEKALHHYPVEHYQVLGEEWPQCAGLLAAGVLGENLSTSGLTEHEVCIGDVFALGSARIQLSQPRSPCWKIDLRLKVNNASRFVEAAGVTGWYYRVLAEGEIGGGDYLELLERPNPWLSVADYWDAVTAHRPDPQLLQRIARAPGLAADKAARWQQRASWLLANDGQLAADPTSAARHQPPSGRA